MRKILLSTLLSLLLPMTASAYDAEIDGIYYNFLGDEASVTWGDNDYTGAVTIPSSVTHNESSYNVTSIGVFAFYACSGLTSITIPESVTSIGDGAFEFCSGLKSIAIPNSVTSIGINAFYGCGLTSPIYNKVIFAYMPTSYEGEYQVPDGIIEIAGGAFNNCRRSLTSITIPNSVIIIGEIAFVGCSGLTSFTIPNNVTKIGSRAFSDCSRLTSVTIGSGLTSIGGSAFRDCRDLTDVYCYATEPPSAYYHDEEYDEDYYAFDIEHIKENTTLHVPEGSVELYKETKPWCWFKNMAALTDADPDPNGPDAIESTKAEEAVTEVARYDIQGRRLTASQTQGSTNAKGINIIRYSDGTTRKVLVK